MGNRKNTKRYKSKNLRKGIGGRPPTSALQSVNNENNSVHTPVNIPACSREKKVVHEVPNVEEEDYFLMTMLRHVM